MVATSAGTRLYIGTTAAVAATDSYTEVGEVISIGAIGRVYNKIDYMPLNSRGVKKFKGGFNEGDPEISLGKDITDAGQAAMRAALLTDYDYNFKLVDNDDIAPVSATITMATGTPGVITWTGHGLAVGTPVVFTTTGGLLTGLTAGTTYYVKTVIDADTFSVAATVGGSAIALSSTQSGVHTGTTAPVGSYQLFKAQVFSYQDAPRTPESIISATTQLGIQSGSLAETVRLDN